MLIFAPGDAASAAAAFVVSSANISKAPKEKEEKKKGHGLLGSILFNCHATTPAQPAKDAPATGGMREGGRERWWLVTRRWQRSAYYAAHHRDLQTRCAAAATANRRGDTAPLQQ